MISKERLDELRSEVGDDDFEEIIALFIADSDSLLARLRDTSEPAEAEDLLHTLKGSALNLGFDEVARLCREGQGGAAGSPSWAAKFCHLLDVYERSKARLAAIT